MQDAVPHHIGHPGILYGGMIASVVDCHGTLCAEAEVVAVRMPTAQPAAEAVA